LSGGIDSALVAAIAADALGAENVTTIALPTEFNAEESTILAGILAENLGTNHMVVPIQAAYESINTIFQAGVAPGMGLPQENMQSRLRTIVLMGFANRTGAVNLGGSNKSEAFVGYSTLFGDLGAGYFPIADVVKTDVYALASLVNSKKEIIPQRIIDRPPSGELNPDQLDENDLPSYEIIDAVIKVVVEGAPIESISWIDPEILADLKKLFYRAEHKRDQMARLTKVTPRSFGIEWNKSTTRRY